MKNLFYAVILLALSMRSMDQPLFIQLPKEIWAKIFSDLITKNEHRIKNYDEIKKFKLLSKFFYSLCDSNAIHYLISPDPFCSTLVLNTKNKRAAFDKYFFKADRKDLFWIFQCAVTYNVPHVITKTIERGVEPNEWYGLHFKTTGLCSAARNNNLKAAQALLDQPLTNPNAADEFGETPLTLAAKENHDKMLQLLLKHPMTNVERTNRGNETALTVALNNHQEMAANILILDQERRRTHTLCEQFLKIGNVCDPTLCTIS